MSGVSMAIGVSAVDILGGLPDGLLASPLFSPASATGSGILYGSGGAGRTMIVVNGVGEWYMSGTMCEMKSTALFGWASAAVASSAIDVGMSRVSSGVTEINAGTAGTPAGTLRLAALAVLPATAIAAGGNASGVTLSSSNLGVYVGSGLPTISAAQGSIYLRSDGSSVSTRLYVNTNGTTGWTNVTTAT